MFRKVMQISDELMWSYWELLTDRSVSQIESMKRRIAAGELHPMKAKMDLGRTIVTDFHSAAAATRAEEEFTRVVRQGEVPADVVNVSLPEDVVVTTVPGQTGHGLVVRVDRMLARIGLADSASEAARKRKEGAVSIGDSTVQEPTFYLSNGKHMVRVGKKYKYVTVPNQ
jgi:tyrosyl-tRNA synthetase